jgi:hypothetical protein
MKWSRLTKIGVIAIGAGILAFGAWQLWLETRIKHPVTVPLSMAAGEVITPEFKVNLDKYYVISIEADGNIENNDLSCMMGVSRRPTWCNRESVIHANWRVMTDRQTVAEGSSDDNKSGGGDYDDRKNTMERSIGAFKGSAGKKYVLYVDFVKDGRSLAMAKPRLKVDLAATWIEDTLLQEAVVYAVAFTFVIVGAILLVISAVIRIGNRHWINGQ